MVTAAGVFAPMIGDDSGTGASADSGRAAVAAFDENPNSTTAAAQALPTRVNPTAEGVLHVLAFKGPSILAKSVGRGLEADAALGRAANVVKTSCFAAGTIVHTETGLRPIEDVQVGDLVWSEDVLTGELALHRVLQTIVTPQQPVLDVVIDDGQGNEESVRVTFEHPFWTHRGWVGARYLRPADGVMRRSGAWSHVVVVRDVSERLTVYNFEVQGFHTYFVGTQGALVHNQCVNLAAHEAAGGHLLDRHVGKTLQDLADRLVAQPYIPRASTFGSLAEAEGAAAAVLTQNSSAIAAWTASGANGKLAIDAAFSGGTVLERTSEVTVGTAARLVLRGNGAGGFFVLTGFPLP